MGFDLNSETGAAARWSGEGWAIVLAVAETYGWTPPGTEPPEGVAAAEWNGDYATNDGARVTREDAAALADALERALADPKRSEVELDLSRALNAAIREMEIEEFGAEVANEKEPEPTTFDPADLRDLVAFLRRGAFRID